MSGDDREPMRVIAVEEHAWTPALRRALLEAGGDDTVDTWSADPQTDRRLIEIGDERLARMDAMGVDVQVLSITAPGVQQLPPELAVSLACDANDVLADAVRYRPDRFAAFATLPTPDPSAAAAELQRCVDGLGFVGAMLFPRTGNEQLDAERFRPIFEAAAELDVALYIHPGLPPKAVREACYRGFGQLTDLVLATGGWGWHAEAGLAALRLILAGTFDRHPDLQIILGHMGEMLVSFADRADTLTKTARLERSVADCITGNIYATFGGVFSYRMLRQVTDILGPNRILFAVDDPYNVTVGKQDQDGSARGFCRDFIERAPSSAEQKRKLAYENAERLLFVDRR